MHICLAAFVAVPVAIPHPPLRGTFPPGEGIFSVPEPGLHSNEPQMFFGLGGAAGRQAVPYGIDERIPFNLFSTGGAMSHCPLK